MLVSASMQQICGLYACSIVKIALIWLAQAAVIVGQLFEIHTAFTPFFFSRRLEGHFGELALLSFGSFTVEKCFTCGSLSLKELIASELSSVQIELSRTKHGPHLLKKLDVPRFVSRPEQWKSMQTSRQAAQKEFSELFASEEVLQPNKKAKRKVEDTLREDVDFA